MDLLGEQYPDVRMKATSVTFSTPRAVRRPALSPAFVPRRANEEVRRLEELFTRERGFVANVLRNMGVPERDVDDATQQAFIVAARKLGGVRRGAERAFLFRVSIYVAAHARRSLGRKRETFGDIPELAVEQAGAEELVDEQRARRRLDHVLSSMDASMREVFMLHEVERMTMLQIANTLEMPPGTVASRLRRARTLFRGELERLQPASP